MLQALKICVACAGRLYQLFEFNWIKQTLDEKEADSDRDESTCQFCVDGKLMEYEFKDIVVKAIAATKWAEVSKRKSHSHSIF
jgi:hypothetical protein